LEQADLERSLQIRSGSRPPRLWEASGTGAVVSYSTSVARLRAECDVGGFESRIDERGRRR
jgi:hypothetical protein